MFFPYHVRTSLLLIMSGTTGVQRFPTVLFHLLRDAVLQGGDGQQPLSLNL